MVSNDELVDNFLKLAVVHYSSAPDNGPRRFAKAAHSLRENPELKTSNIYTAAATGQIDHLQKLLDSNPDSIDIKGGPLDWEPLLYCTYARVPGYSTLEAARLLLKRGANPNVHFVSNNQYIFTALTGAFGEGEGGPVVQPPHPEYIELCTLLLEHGANPNDSQAAYNRCFQEDNTCLELLLKYGLNTSHKNNWKLQNEDGLQPNPVETLHFQFIHAIKSGFTDRVKLLLDHAIDIEKPDNTYETRCKGKKPLEIAMILGEQQIVKLLIESGAQPVELSDVDRFQMACSQANVQLAKELLATNPEITTDVESLKYEMLNHAVQRSRHQSLQLMIDLGFDLNAHNDRTALHEAAFAGNLEIIQLLMDNGADSSLRDSSYLVPAIGFALHAEHHSIVEYLDTMPMDIYTAAIRGRMKQLQRHIESNPELINQRFETLRSQRSNNPHDSDWMTPLAFAVAGNQAEAMTALLNHGADPTISTDSGLSLSQFSVQMRCHENITEQIDKALTDRKP